MKQVTTDTQWAVDPALAIVDDDGLITISSEHDISCSNGVWHHSSADPTDPNHQATCEGEILLVGYDSFDGMSLIYRFPGCGWTFLVPLA